MTENWWKQDIPEVIVETTFNNQSKVLKTKLTNMGNLIVKFQEKLKITDKPIPALVFTYYWSSDYDIKFTPNLKQNYTELAEKLYKICYKSHPNDTPDFDRIGADKYISHSAYKNSGLVLFTIKKIYTQDDYYIFESSDWLYYNVLISDFNSNWIASQSLKPWKPEISTKSNLIKGFILNNNGDSIQILKNNNIQWTIVWDIFTVVDSNQWSLIVVNRNLLEITQIDEKWVQTIIDTFEHPFWIIEKIQVDNNKNFLLLISKYEDWKKKLHIIHRTSYECIETFNDIVDILIIDNKNDLVCLNKDGNIVNIDTNFDQFPVGYIDDWEVIKEWKQKITKIEDKTRHDLEAMLCNWWVVIDAEELKNGNWHKHNWEQDDSALIEFLWKTKIWEDTLKSLFDKADDVAKIETVYNAFLMIKANPIVSAVKWIWDTIENAINTKRFELIIKWFTDKIRALKDDLESLTENDEDYYITLTSLKSRIDEIKKQRSQVPLISKELDDNLKNLTTIINDKITEFQDKHSDWVIISIEHNIEKIQVFLSWIDYLASLTQVYNTDIWKQTETMITLLQEPQRTEYKNKLTGAVTTRQLEMSRIEKQTKLWETQILREKIKETDWNIVQLAEILNTIDDENNLDIIKWQDALYLRIQLQLQDLPVKLSEKLGLKLNSIFEDRRLQIKLTRLDAKWVTFSLDEYGMDTSLYFSDAIAMKIGFKIKWNRMADGNVRLELCYDDGTCFDIDRYLQDPSLYSEALISNTLKGEMTQSEFLKFQKNLSDYMRWWKDKLIKLRNELKSETNELKSENNKTRIAQIKKRIEELNEARITQLFAQNLAKKLNLNPRSRLEKVNPKFIVLEEEKATLTKMSHWFIIQKHEQKWIDILEWWPWLGKTAICRFFAAMTNREIIRIQCSKMDPSDMFFSPQLKSWETTRQAADWITLMQKPGTIVLFDEIDKLNSESFERLHSFFDDSRSIYDPQIGRVKAHPDCLLVGTRNSYEKMSNPIVSRAVITNVIAPGELNEAFKVSKYSSIEFFEKMSFEDFKKIWQKFMIDWEKPWNTASEKKVFETLTNIRKLIAVLNEVRKKQASDDFDDKFDYEMSYRDAEQIFLRHNMDPTMTFKDKLLEILIPKTRAVVLAQEDKDAQERILVDIVNKEFK